MGGGGGGKFGDINYGKSGGIGGFNGVEVGEREREGEGEKKGWSG